jgi:hypothetical protein
MNARRLMRCLDPGIAPYHSVAGRAALCPGCLFPFKSPKELVLG